MQGCFKILIISMMLSFSSSILGSEKKPISVTPYIQFSTFSFEIKNDPYLETLPEDQRGEKSSLSYGIPSKVTKGARLTAFGFSYSYVYAEDKNDEEEVVGTELDEGEDAEGEFVETRFSYFNSYFIAEYIEQSYKGESVLMYERSEQYVDDEGEQQTRILESKSYQVPDYEIYNQSLIIGGRVFGDLGYDEFYNPESVPPRGGGKLGVYLHGFGRKQKILRDNAFVPADQVDNFGEDSNLRGIETEGYGLNLGLGLSSFITAQSGETNFYLKCVFGFGASQTEIRFSRTDDSTPAEENSIEGKNLTNFNFGATLGHFSGLLNLGVSLDFHRQMQELDSIATESGTTSGMAFVGVIF